MFAFGFNNEQFSDHVLELVSEEETEKSSSSKSGKNRGTTEEDGIVEISRSGKGEGRKKKISSTKLYVSSLLLAANSDFFRSLFSNGMRETTQKTVQLVVNSSDHELFIDLIHFLYTGTFQTTSGRKGLLQMLVLADKYSVISVVKEIFRELSSQELTIEACCDYLETLEIVHNINNSELLSSCMSFIEQEFENFDLCWDSQTFLSLNPQALEVILKSDKLKVYTENTIFLAFSKWINANPTYREREEILYRLLPLIRFPLMTVDFLVDVVEKNSLFADQKPYLAELVKEAYFYKCCSPVRRQISFVAEEKRRLIQPRAGNLDNKVITFYMDVPNASTMTKSLQSPHFAVHGYVVYLLVCKEDRKDGSSTIGLYLRVDCKQTFCKDGFASMFPKKVYVKNFSSNQFEFLASHTDSRLKGGKNSGWGWADVFGAPLEQIVKSDYMKDNTISFKVKLSTEPF